MNAITNAHYNDIPSPGREGKKGIEIIPSVASRGGVTTKKPCVVGEQGLPIRLILTAGQSHDGRAVDNPLDHVGAGTLVLADKVYDTGRIRSALREKAAFANIPPKSNRRLTYLSTWL